jgi:F-type H+-transporting ATPase subunit epsilon
VADVGTATANKVASELVAPERLLPSEEVDMVVVPGAAGDFGVLPGHSLLMSLLRPGLIEIWQGNQVERRIFVAGGFAEVNERGCTVLAEEATPVEEIDRDQARQRLADAEDSLREARDDPARAAAEREIGVVEAMLQAAGA